MMFKRLSILVSGAVVVAALVGCSAETTTTSNNNVKPPASKPAESTKKINLKVYEQIKTGDALTGKGGMSKEEVIKLIGEPDNKTESSSGNMKMEICTWMKNVEGDLGANVSVTFVNGKASAKANMGLK